MHEMPKEVYNFCIVCRINHTCGRKHIYTTRHKECMRKFTAKAKQSLKEIRFFLQNPKFITNQEQDRNKVWCYFCQKELVERGSSIACESHKKKVRHLLHDNGGDLGLQSRFYFTEDELKKWVEKCSILSLGKDIGDEKSQLDSLAAGSTPDTDIQSKNLSQISAIGGITSSQAFASNFSHNVEPSPSSDTFFRNAHGFQVEQHGNLSTGKNYSMKDPQFGTPNWVKMEDSVTPVLTYGVGTPTQRLTEEKNVHSGGIPPWLMSESTVNPAEVSAKGCIPSKNKLRNLSRTRNPNRVGAEWAEKRLKELGSMKHAVDEAAALKSSVDVACRAEIEQNAGNKALSEDTWMPNFGRVWQSGSRKDSKREFEAELREGSRGKVRIERRISAGVAQDIEKEVVVKPYVSKRKLKQIESI